jgi:uncharacterized YigZ family protein
LVSDPTSYLTVARPAVAEVEVKRSRFLCRIEPVTTEEQARAVVEEERKGYWDARHHCSAFVLGPAGDVQRSNDDGEPSGTAGAPMLEVLRGREVSDVVAVVTRWFGGVLLGAGGLVRAYSDAVRAGLDEAGVRQRRLLNMYDVDVPHADAGKLENGLRAHGVAVLGVDYAAQARMHVAVPAAEAEALPRLLAELTGGTLEPEPCGTDWVDA